jgi:hypothetical protein
MDQLYPCRRAEDVVPPEPGWTECSAFEDAIDNEGFI